MALDAWFAGRRIAMLDLPTGGRVPLRFTDPVAEHRATRARAGLFDFSFMGAWDFAGPAACAALARMQTRNLRALPVGRIAYSLLLDERGVVVVDATVWRLADDTYRLFTGRPSDAARIWRACEPFGAVPVDRSGHDAVIAIQGPASAQVLARVIGRGAVAALPWFGFTAAQAGEHPVLAGRLGYSGELGYEILVDRARGADLWRSLLAAGADADVLECGFEAADTLRIECGYVLFTRELAAGATPRELGLERLVDLWHGPFVGRDAVRRARGGTPTRRLAGLAFTPRPGTLHAVRRRATVTSECLAPTLGVPIALGCVDADAAPGDVVYTDDGRRALVRRLPFYDAPRLRTRAQPVLRAVA
jgi:aminomethyltransferase